MGTVTPRKLRRFAAVFHSKMRVDNPASGRTVSPPFRAMSTNEQNHHSPTPAEIPFTTPQAMSRYVTDTGKILPRKYTGLSAKHQRAVTRTLKHSRNMLLAQ
jgi:small subunit ribosomal protein S18